jgi:hypothetical protein
MTSLSSSGFQNWLPPTQERWLFLIGIKFFKQPKHFCDSLGGFTKSARLEHKCRHCAGRFVFTLQYCTKYFPPWQNRKGNPSFRFHDNTEQFHTAECYMQFDNTKGKALLRLHGNNGYANAPHHIIRTLRVYSGHLGFFFFFRARPHFCPGMHRSLKGLLCCPKYIIQLSM